jgi:hypothetical protein
MDVPFQQSANRALNLLIQLSIVSVYAATGQLRADTMLLFSDSVTPCRNRRVTLSQKELQRVKVVENAVNGKLTGDN